MPPESSCLCRIGRRAWHIPYVSFLLGVCALTPTKCCHYAVQPLAASRDDGSGILMSLLFSSLPNIILKTGQANLLAIGQ